MPIPDPKRQSLQDQVNAKIKGNSSEEEVLSWLWERHLIRGTDATEMVDIARRNRARIVRERSLYGMIISAVAALASGGIILAQWSGGFLYISRSLIMLAACAFSAVWFARYLARFLSGRSALAE
jgi:hypothetical protein